MFALESPHRGDSDENTQYTIFNMNKKNTLDYPKSAAKVFFSKGLRNEFETAVVNEPSVFEPLKFNCITFYQKTRTISNLMPLLSYVHFDSIYSGFAVGDKKEQRTIDPVAYLS